MHGSRKLCERGPTLTNKKAFIGPPAKRHLNGFCWGADDGPTLSACLVAL